MANFILSFPNWIDSTYFVPVFMGGDWRTTAPLDLLKTRFVTEAARSQTDAILDTQFDVYYPAPRDHRVMVVPIHNVSDLGKHRNRYTNTPKFSGVSVGASAIQGASSITVQASTTVAATLTDGDYFQIAGDSTVYKVSATVSLAAGGSDTLSFSPVLTSALSGGEAITCLTGDYTTPLHDSGWVDTWPILYPWGSIGINHPQWWTGKLERERRAEIPLPIVDVLSSPVNAQYQRVEIDDTQNEDEVIDLGRLFDSPGWQPSRNFGYGNSLVWEYGTEVQTALGGARWYRVVDGRRVVRITVSALDEQEAFTQGFDMQAVLRTDRQLVFIYDPDDTEHLFRRTMVCTMRKVNPLVNTSHGPSGQRLWGTTYELEEVIE